ncbi:MAG: class II aldolase/adducin family protein [Dehalococcoidia bacterium]|nr:class II aldolase/adducin family protein [Dehalococcoidia bacterium]
MADSLADVKYKVAVANRILSAMGLAAGHRLSLGHASMRLPDDPTKFLVKGRGYKMDALPAMLPQDMILCDLDGNMIDGPPGSTQCFEVKIHSCVYKLNPEVQSVVHVHPTYVVLMSTQGHTIKPLAQEGVQLVAKPLPIYPHTRTIQTDEEGMDHAQQMGKHKAILLQGHGATTRGADLEEAVMNMLHLEEQAKMNFYALSAFGPNYKAIPDELIAEMSNRIPLAEVPHFKEPIAKAKGQPRVGGVWAYYAEMVSKDL